MDLRPSPSWRERSDRRIWRGGASYYSPPPPDASSLTGSFLQHGFTIKSILEGAQRPKDLVAGSVTVQPPHRMLRHSQARSSSMDLRSSPSWRERSDRRIWRRGASYYSPPPPDASSLASSFLQHGFTIKSILEGAQRPKVISFQSRTSPSWRERSDRRIWWRGA
ncbi:MAG: hypothetical protein FWF18_04925 [Dehalococcoidia bacterium]|nr:hypothetical protein [Dehalococcoidia bacterium]